MNIAKAFRAGVPLVSVTTGDPAATIRSIGEQLAGFEDSVGLITWDVIQGAKAAKTDTKAVEALAGLPQQDYSGSMVNFLADLKELTRSSFHG